MEGVLKLLWGAVLGCCLGGGGKGLQVHALKVFSSIPCRCCCCQLPVTPLAWSCGRPVAVLKAYLLGLLLSTLLKGQSDANERLAEV